MSFADSPKVEYAADGKPPETGRVRRFAVRIAIIVLLLVTIGINVSVWMQGDVINQLAGTDGAVRGRVFTASGEPLADAEVFLADAPWTVARTDADGYFVLDKIPTGERTLIVGYGERGEEFTLVVNKGVTTQAGELVFVTPTADDYWE